MKVAGISALGLAGALGGNLAVPGAGWAFQAPGSSYGDTPKQLKAKRWGMAIFTDRFATQADFEKVMSACHKPHNIPDVPDADKGIKWIWQGNYHETFTEAVAQFSQEAAEQRGYLMLCNHCENAPCVRVCPTKATFKRADGIVVMDYHRCIGCRFCMAGCPYGARSFNYYNPREYIADTNLKFPTRMRGVVEKCTFCSERLSEGLLPYCVEASDGAIVFGDLGDPESEVSQAIRENYSVVRKPSVGTGPSVYYII